MKRKIISVLLSAVLLFGMLAVPTSAASFIDVDAKTTYQEAIGVLVALNLLKGYEDNSFRPENTITRAEFATVITRMLGLESVAAGASAKQIFTDMTAGGGEHWASGYIKVAYDLGIILGMGDGTFAPDNPVTYEQALKMMVCALGYEAAAVDMGGWPDGYVAQATTLGMTKGIRADKTSMSASRGMVAQVLYNSLEVQIAEKQSNGTVHVTSKTILGNKLGYARFNNYMVSQVDGTDSISDNDIRLQPGQLAFGQSREAFGYTKAITKAEAKALLGNYVKGYYKIGDDETVNDIIYLVASNTKSEEVTILSENIYDFNRLELEYYTDEDQDKTEEIKISTNTQLMYNGSLYDYSNGSADERNLSKWLDPSSADFVDGQVRLVENTGDKEFDTIFIEDYETYVAKAAVQTSNTLSSNNYVIYDNYVSGKSIRIDPYSPSVTAEFYNAQTGAEMRIEDIKAMNVLSVAANMSGTKFKVYVSTKTIKGKIDEFTNAGEYVIAGKTYVTTASYDELVATDVIIPKTGAEGTFYLDHNNRICAAKITLEDAGAYAYVTNAGIDDERAILKLMNLSGSPSTPTKVKCATNVKVNGRTVSDPQDVLDALEAMAGRIGANDDAGNATYAQLIRYVKNTKGEITKITTISVSGNEIVTGKNEDVDKLVTGVEKTQYTYSSSSGFKSKVFVNSSTLVLVVPDDRQDEGEYKRSTATSYFKSGSSYSIEAYDINGSSVAKVILVYNGEVVSAETQVDHDTAVRFVTKVSERLSATDEEMLVYNIEVYENGKKKVYETADTSVAYQNIKPGDVIRFGLDSDGRINKLGRANTGTHELDVNALTPYFKYDKSLTSGNALHTGSEYYFESLYGTVSSLSEETIFIAPADVDDGGEVATLDTSAARGYKLRSDVQKYYVRLTDTGTEVSVMSDLNSVIEFGDLCNANASHIYAQARTGALRMLVIVVDERTAP